MKKIAVTGSLAFDYIMDFPESFEENIMPDKLKTLSVSFLAKNFTKNFGGVAGNIAYTLSLLKQNPIIVASGGGNDFDPYTVHLRENAVDDRSIQIVKSEFTANMFMITDKNNCQIAGFYPGAMANDENLTLSSVEVDFAVIAPTVPKAMDNFITEAQKLSIPYLFNPAQQISRLSAETLQKGIEKATILIGNDYEISLIQKKTGLTLDDIRKKVDILVTTLGEKGSEIQQNGKKVTVGIAKPAKIVDPTGAGDAYIAGFLAGFLNKLPVKECGEMGATAASFAIENYGTQRHSFSRTEFDKRHRQAFEI